MLIVGNYIENIKCESFLDGKENRVRIRPLPDQGIPTDIVIESFKCFRNLKEYPLGTVFIAENVKVCKKDIGRVYLRANKQMLRKVD